MERLWSPWRMEYLEAARDEEPGTCVFCALLDGDDPDGSRVLAREELAFVTLAKYPYNPGHLLILPVRHIGELEEVTEAEHAAVARLLRRSIRALREVSDPHGFNVGMNLGESAGAGIADHLHLHIVPRWRGDTSFMTVSGGVRVIPEDLHETYRKLKSALEEQDGAAAG